MASPHRFHYADTLSKAFTEESLYDVVLANPPFKGAIDASDVNSTLPTKVKKTEILFLHLFLHGSSASSRLGLGHLGGERLRPLRQCLVRRAACLASRD
jgi:hypothetical protein